MIMNSKFLGLRQLMLDLQVPEA